MPKSWGWQRVSRCAKLEAVRVRSCSSIVLRQGSGSAQRRQFMAHGVIWVCTGCFFQSEWHLTVFSTQRRSSSHHRAGGTGRACGLLFGGHLSFPALPLRAWAVKMESGVISATPSVLLGWVKRARAQGGSVPEPPRSPGLPCWSHFTATQSERIEGRRVTQRTVREDSDSGVSQQVQAL